MASCLIITISKTMKSINVLHQVGLAAIASVTALTSAQAPAMAMNLVQNGSFEVTPTKINNGGWTTYNQIEGWQATSGGKIEIQRGAAGKAFDGSNLLELDSHHYNKNAPVLGVFQDISTTVGQTYRLSFMYSARPNISASENMFSVLFGDEFSKQLTAGKGGSQTNWMEYVVDVVATSTTSRLQFNYEGNRDTLGAYIDAVKVEAVPGSKAVPEPTTMAGIALASFGFAAAKKRSKRTA